MTVSLTTQRIATRLQVQQHFQLISGGSNGNVLSPGLYYCLLEEHIV
ncbi:hypothetical protein LSH36_89g06000 [Paralvinella palmiformis]|uniref:Uncharacterized protein n=1 Tax=Paralvinella palmiformis TaxID=53620 RepID=A0AAD9K148_9ANNE|nr:hypothetical protein LSH36_89g06000 [Paralvinella palmiformis]